MKYPVCGDNVIKLKVCKMSSSLNVSNFEIMLIFFAIITLGFAVTFWWLENVKRLDRYLKKFPGPKPIPIFGNVLQLGNSPTEKLWKLLDFQKIYGNVYKLESGPGQRTLVVADSQLAEFLLRALITKADVGKFLQNWLGTGLPTLNGEIWRSHRKMLTPTFHVQNLEQFIEVFDSTTNVLIEKLHKELDREAFDAHKYVELCMLDILCESIMNTSINALHDAESAYLKSVHEVTAVIIKRLFSPIRMFNFLYQFTKEYQLEKKALKVLHGYSKFVIKSRKDELSKNSHQVDLNTDKPKRLILLDTLLQATIGGQPLSDEEIRSEVDTFLFTGHDTVASTMSFAMYNLAKHPEVQNKAVQELKAIFGNDLNRPATYQELQNLKYIEMILKETMRLYPPGPVVSRLLEEDMEYNGQILPKGLVVRIFIFGLHRDPEIYPDPEKFDPDRFLPENCVDRNHGNYIPFGTGPRVCPGQKYAMLNMKSVLSKFLRHFELLPPIPEHNLIISSELIIKAVNGTPVRLRKRNF